MKPTVVISCSFHLNFFFIVSEMLSGTVIIQHTGLFLTKSECRQMPIF